MPTPDPQDNAAETPQCRCRAQQPGARAASATQRPSLSRREAEVLREWLLRDSKADVAHRLFLAEATVNTYLSRIRTKYALAGRPAPSKTMLLVMALRDGVVEIDSFH